ncbi:HEAT repeat domain-containing protein [Streptomyces sp. NPDC003691]
MERATGGARWESLGGALALLARGDLSDCARLLGHPDPRVRENALAELQRRGEGAVAYGERLIELLGDANPGVRRRAVLAFEGIGPGALPVLRRVRRAAAAGPGIRAGALEALAAIGGPGAMDPADLAAVRRLTRVKRLAEIPEPLALCGFWYAIPTVDQTAVLDAFGLGDPEPVTLRTGAAAWCRDRHARGRGAERGSRSRVFVSPGLDGWTLVFGDSSQDQESVRRGGGCTGGGSGRSMVRARCSALGGRFGAAQWYGASCGGAWTAWCIAEGPDIVRYYDVYDAERRGDEGPAHPAERGYLPAHESAEGNAEGAGTAQPGRVSPYEPGSASGRASGHPPAPGLPRPPGVRSAAPRPLSGAAPREPCRATAVAARLSVDPSALGPATAVTGSGVLALTAYGRRHGQPPGALPV